MQKKNTKIICTIGPSCWDEETMEKLALAGMDMARLNFSHGNHVEKGRKIDSIRKISKKLNKPLAIIADLQGPKLRLGSIKESILEQGQIIQISADPIDEEIPIQFDVSPYLKKGQRILLNDGLIEVKVLEIKGRTVVGEVQNQGLISSNKGVNVPDTNLAILAVTEKDFKDAEFALKKKVDFIALSFVQSAKDLEKISKLIKKYHVQTKIIAKLEKPQAIVNLEEIVKAADSIMVARGDLGIETEIAKVPLLQKRIIKMSHKYFKPVIVATQMLESMTHNPRPTRAEVSDVATAVFDKADAVMLSAETATGKYPVEAVKMMASIIQSVESDDEYKKYIVLPEPGLY